MRHFFYLLFALTLFSACSGDDKEDEIFITDETLSKEAIKAQWIVQDWYFKSNSEDFDKAMNSSCKSTLKAYIFSLHFDFNPTLNADAVSSEMTSKNGGLGIGEINYYTVSNSKISVKENDGSYTIYTFKVSENTLILEDTVTKDNLVASLKRDNTSQEIIDAFIKMMPSDFSGTQTMLLKKK